MPLNLQQTETFRKWEAKLKDRRARTIIAARLMRLAEGLAGDVEPVGGGVRELRIHYGPGYRIYFRHYRDTIIILLCGGDKSSQARDIIAAKKMALTWEQNDE
jgi:putative addiction module killer protein